MISNLKSKLSKLSSNVNAVHSDFNNKVSREEARKKTASSLDAYCINNKFGSFIIKRYKFKLSDNPLLVPHKSVWEQLECNDISKTLFLDTETSGLSSGCFAFLVGVAYFENEHLIVEQLFLDDLDDEEALLYYLWNKFKSYNIITYNGRSFDIPLINNRLVLNTITRERFGLKNLDLLQYSRIIWSESFDNCSLSTIEQKILGFNRKNDIPGSEIPYIYQNFLKTKNTNTIKNILQHNFYDITSMVQLINIIGEIMFSEKNKRNFVESFSVGKYFFNRKNYTNAKKYFIEACTLSYLNKGGKSDIISGLSLKYLVLLYKKEDATSSVIQCCLAILKRNKFDIFACIELAKIYEHKYKNYSLALNYSFSALKSTKPLYKAGYTREDILHRIKRLKSKKKEGK